MLNYFLNIQKELLHAYENSKRLKHNVVKGSERELIISHFLHSHIPNRAEVGSGMIVDQQTTNLNEIDRNTCPQIDILLANEFCPNLALYGGTKFYFAESVISVLEIKSKLTTSNSQSSELNRILKHAEKVKKLKRQILGMYVGKGGPSKQLPYFVISFEADVDCDVFFDRLQNRYNDDIELMPDGFFNLDQDNCFAYLRKSRSCPVGIMQNNDDFFAGGKPTSGEIISLLWFTLISNIEDTRLLMFPAESYINKLYNI